MNDIVPKQNGGVGSWLGEWIANGKLPGAVKAIAHVVGATGNAIAAGVDIGKAKAEQISQGIKDETEARSIMKAALARQAVDMLPERKEFAHRAMNRWFSEELKKQENREAVAGKAAEYLTKDPPEKLSAEPTEDWLNIFGEYAEKASDEKIRTYWSKILNGEIRNAGTFSPNAMRVLSSLDAETMRQFSQLCTAVVGEKLIFRVPDFNTGAGLDVIHDLEAHGLVQGTPLMHTTHEFKLETPAFFVFRHYFLRLDPKVEFKIQFDSIFLTKAGNALARIIDIPESQIEIQKCARFLKDKVGNRADVILFKINGTTLDAPLVIN